MREEKALAKEPAEAFRTRIRVKGASNAASEDRGASAPPAQASRSLMEALKEVAPDRTKQPIPERPAERPATAPRGPDQPARMARAVKASIGRAAAAKLRHLERLRDAAQGLERVTRGEIEEATVEIVRHDGNPPSRRGRARR